MVDPGISGAQAPTSPLGLGGPLRRVKTCVVPFTDNAGKPARMVFRGHSCGNLPPLYTFAIYFTHTSASPRRFDSAGLLDGIFNGSPLDDSGSIRLDLYFLPGASSDDCIAHYRGEKAARGDYRAQISALENARDERIAGPSVVGRLPGLVPDYMDDVIEAYHGILFVCHEKDWRKGAGFMRRVEFDRVSEQEYRTVDDNIPPLVFKAWEAIGKASPLYGASGTTMGWWMFEKSMGMTEHVTSAPLQEARRRGWTGWR